MDGVQLLPQGYSHLEETIYFFPTKFPEIPGTHFIDLRKMKGRVDSWFWTLWDPWIGNPACNLTTRLGQH